MKSPFKLLDGALGSELIKRGEKLPNYIWSAESNITNPELVYRIHREYVHAGADYLTANTFRTTPRAYLKTGLNEKEAYQRAQVSLNSAILSAKKAAMDNVKVLGSVAPLEDCYTPELFPGAKIALQEFTQIAEWLSAEKIDGFLLETMNNLDETQACLEATKKYNIPIWVSYYLSDSIHLKSGEQLSDGLLLAQEFRVDCLLINCNSIQQTEQTLEFISGNWFGNWGIYPNLGIGKPAPDGDIKHYHSNDEFLSLVRKAVNLGAVIIGGCCGSSPEHIAMLCREFPNF